MTRSRAATVSRLTPQPQASLCRACLSNMSRTPRTPSPISSICSGLACSHIFTVATMFTVPPQRLGRTHWHSSPSWSTSRGGGGVIFPSPKILLASSPGNASSDFPGQRLLSQPMWYRNRGRAGRRESTPCSHPRGTHSACSSTPAGTWSQAGASGAPPGCRSCPLRRWDGRGARQVLGAARGPSHRAARGFWTVRIFFVSALPQY